MQNSGLYNLEYAFAGETPEPPHRVTAKLTEEERMAAESELSQLKEYGLITGVKFNRWDTTFPFPFETYESLQRRFNLVRLSAIARTCPKCNPEE